MTEKEIESNNKVTTMLSCDKCKFVTVPSRYTIFKEHIKKGHYSDEDNTTYCKECDKEFFNRIYFTSHMKEIHKMEFSSKCDQCGNSFSRPSNLARHIQHVHERSKNWICHICDNNLVTKQVLIRHMNSKHSGIHIPCEICNEEFLEQYR